MGESSLKLEKPKKIPDLNEVMQDPLVRQALAKLKNWGKNILHPSPGKSLDSEKNRPRGPTVLKTKYLKLAVE